MIKSNPAVDNETHSKPQGESMSQVFTKLMLMVIVMTVAIGTNSANASAQKFQLNTKLHGLFKEPLANGSAHFYQTGKRMAFTIKVDEVLLSKKIAVYVNKQLVGETDVDDSGSAGFSVDTRRGQKVPEMFAGDVVEVVDAVSGSVILTGALMP